MHSDRPTAEIVVLIFATTIAIVLVLSGAGVVVLELVRPETDLTDATETIREMVGVLIGAVIGFISGRGAVTLGAHAPRASDRGAGGTDTPDDPSAAT